MVEVIRPNGRLIRAGRYINRRGEIIANIVLDTDNGQVHSRASLSAERGFLDLDPFTVLPGLVDCHVHLALPPPRLGDDPVKTMAARLAGCLEYGLVAVRDGGDRLGSTLDLKKDRELPRLVACGPALHPPGSYGTFLGPACGPEHMLDQIADLAGRGAGQIKLLVTGPVNLESMGAVDPPHFSERNLSRLVEEAHRRQLKVMAHTNGVPGIQLALTCGIDSLEHGYGMDEETLACLARSKTTWVPTLAPMAALAAQGPVNLRQTAATALAAQMRAVCRAHDLGIALAVGTDAGAPGVVHGKSFLWELRLLRQAGLSPATLLRAATFEGARLLGLPGGNSDPDRPLAWIAVEGNPLEDLEALNRVLAIII